MNLIVGLHGSLPVNRQAAVRQRGDRGKKPAVRQSTDDEVIAGAAAIGIEQTTANMGYATVIRRPHREEAAVRQRGDRNSGLRSRTGGSYQKVVAYRCAAGRDEAATDFAIGAVMALPSHEQAAVRECRDRGKSLPTGVPSASNRRAAIS